MWNRIRGSSIFYTALSALLMLGLMSQAIAQKPKVMQGGKKARIELFEETWVGDVSLRPGEYRVFCEQSGPDHQMVFIRLSKVGSSSTAPRSETSDVTRVPCRMETAAEKARDWRLYTNEDPSGRRAIKEIVIEGEALRHLFQQE